MDLPGLAFLLENAPDQVEADAGTVALEVGRLERARTPVNRAKDQRRL